MVSRPLRAESQARASTADLIVFLHMHKCAGSAVVQMAMESGRRLPRNHQNGNLPLADGEPQLYSRLSRSELRDILWRQVHAGVDFLAMEWDFPRFEFFPSDMTIHFLTCLRSPLSRAVSNFRMDRLSGWYGREGGFRDFLDGTSLYRSHNYYCRKLCGNDGPTVDQEDATYAADILGQFDNVIVMEAEDVGQALSRSGINGHGIGIVNDFSSSPRRLDYGDEADLHISPQDRFWFTQMNYADNFLFQELLARPIARHR